MNLSRAVRAAAASAAAAALLGTTAAVAQPARPKAMVRAVPPAAVRPANVVALTLHVELPADVHVQAHEPSDPLLIPTVATVELPAGLTLEGVEYPAPEPFTQTGREEPLLVLGPEFDIVVRALVAAGAEAGAREVPVPVTLRYQACNDTTCFPPARATAAWIVAVDRGR